MDSRKMEVAEYLHDILLKNPVVLDTETTGLGDDARIVEISVIDIDGNVLLDTLINPHYPIPEGATAIHGIRDEDVQYAPSWHEIQPALEKALIGREILIYNAEYDAGLIISAIARNGKNPTLMSHIVSDSICMMKAFAIFNGEWNARRNEYRWKKLTDAARIMKVRPQGKAHRALSDCLMTLGVVKKMALFYKNEQDQQIKTMALLRDAEKEQQLMQAAAAALLLKSPPKQHEKNKVSYSILRKILTSPLMIFILAIGLLVFFGLSY